MLHVLLNVSRKMIDRLVEEIHNSKNINNPSKPKLEALILELFLKAKIRLAEIDDKESPTLLKRWEATRTNRNDLVKLMLEIVLSDLPSRLDTLLPSEETQASVSVFPFEDVQYSNLACRLKVSGKNSFH